MYVMKVGVSRCTGEMVSGATGREFDYNKGICASFLVFGVKNYKHVKLTPRLWKSELRHGRVASRQE